jgi:hypothetical protein
MSAARGADLNRSGLGQIHSLPPEQTIAVIGEGGSVVYIVGTLAQYNNH